MGSNPYNFHPSIFSENTFRQHFLNLCNKYNLSIFPNSIPGLKAFVFRTSAPRDKPYHNIYLKWETKSAYYKARYDYGDDSIWKKGAKTVNAEIVLQFKRRGVNPLIVFADPSYMRTVEWNDFLDNSLPFTQHFNNEPVNGIGIEELEDYEEYLKRQKIIHPFNTLEHYSNWK